MKIMLGIKKLEHWQDRVWKVVNPIPLQLEHRWDTVWKVYELVFEMMMMNWSPLFCYPLLYL